MYLYTVYKTTNILDGKFYIGVHRTTNVHDEYLGSGKVLRHAILKHGISNFTKDVLFVFEDKESAYQKEMELVNLDVVNDPMCYNIKIGGVGGWDYALNSPNRDKEKQREICRKLATPERGRLANKALLSKHPKNVFYGKKHSDDTKRKIGDANKKNVGDKNSQFGTMWITNETQNKKWKRDEPLPNGWRRGRI